MIAEPILLVPLDIWGWIGWRWGIEGPGRFGSAPFWVLVANFPLLFSTQTELDLSQTARSVSDSNRTCLRQLFLSETV